MKELLELIHKYGIPAVLFIWVGSLQLELNDTQDRLFDCYDERIDEAKLGDYRKYSDRWYAILPKKLKVHSDDDKKA